MECRSDMISGYNKKFYALCDYAIMSLAILICWYTFIYFQLNFIYILLLYLLVENSTETNWIYWI